MGSCLVHFNFYKGRCWDFIIIGGIGHDALSTNKLLEAGMVFGHGVSSLVCRAVAVVVASGCCAFGGLLPLGVEGLSSPWDFLVG